MDPTMLVMLVVMLLAFWLMSRFARKQQQKMAEEQARRVEEAMVPGTWVRTRAGFYGKVVEVDGDVVTLATALGDESLWAKNAIAGAEEPPFAQDEVIEGEIVDSLDSEVDTEPAATTESSSEATGDSDSTKPAQD